jgi:hypothetical protein
VKSKRVLHVLAAAILVTAALEASTTEAHAYLPATATDIEQILADQPLVKPVVDQAALPGVLPFSDEIDQNQPSGPAYMAAFSQTDLAQSFMQTNGNISGAGILLYSGAGSTDNVTIAVWDGLPNAGGTMLAEASAMGTAGQWVDVYWDAIEITPATTYYLVFTGNFTLGITGDLSNPYPYGMVYANGGFMPFPGYDYGFRTYYDTEASLENTTWAGVKTLTE